MGRLEPVSVCPSMLGYQLKWSFNVRIDFLIATVFSVGALVYSPSPAEAQTSRWVTQIDRLMVDSEYFGGCMAALTVPPQAQPGYEGCSATWVTLDCEGLINTKSEGAAKLSAAQLAYVTGKEVQVQVYAQRKINGYCWARRVDNR